MLIPCHICIFYVNMAEFKLKTEYSPSGDQPEAIEEIVEQVGNATVINLGHTIESREEARSIGEEYNATMVIYGQVTSEGVILYYEVTAPQAQYQTLGLFTIETKHVDNFDILVPDTEDIDYLSGMTCGILHYLDQDQPLFLHKHGHHQTILISPRLHSTGNKFPHYLYIQQVYFRE